jgi:rifampicin phosphotransferase
LQILTGEKLIVRSSAIGEDGDDFSFAGQLDSFVVENNIASVVDGAKKCSASLQVGFSSKQKHLPRRTTH